MTKTEMAAKYRIYKRSEQALRRVADIEKLVGIIRNNSGLSDGYIAQRLLHNLSLVRNDLNVLRDSNKI